MGRDNKDTEGGIFNFKKFSNNYNKHKESWNFGIGIFITLLGIFVSIITIVHSPNNIAIAVSVIGCQIIVVIMCIITFVTFNKNKEIVEEAEEDNQKLIDEINKCKEEYKKISEMNLQLTKKALIFSKNINKRINNFLTLICDETDKYYCSVSHIKEKLQGKEDDADYTALCVQQIEAERQKYSIALYNLYNRYVKGVVEETLNMVYCDLKNKNIALNVSLSLKLFDTTYHTSMDHKKVKIYTAFRDKETYDNRKEREIGERHYSIDLNGDFHKCLSNESYVKNNITDTMEDYLNENFPNSIKYYNCTAVVPIICDYKSDRQFYGFFCCDALNEDFSSEIFDKNTANILYSAALTIGMFFDNINSAWAYMVDADESDFLTYLHNNTYKGHEVK